ncbi:MAG: DUF1848 domain-containing protein [Treponema sp.]|jgi:hypothetical protein|nr:DUF1848 domain-containing protein [Treponema sp.]
MIISVSRRCDIPRFRLDWFMDRLEMGFVETVNPFCAAQVRRVSLRPDPADPAAGAEVLVFWTRDPRPLLARAEELEGRGIPFYVMVTLTGYPGALEPNVPDAETVCRAMEDLAEKIGPRRVIWRYDPVFLSNLTDFFFHRENFAALVRSLRGKIRRVIISLYDPYRGAERRLAALGKSGVLRSSPCTGGEGRPLPQVRDLLGMLADAARRADMEIQSCAEAEDLASLGIRAGACIDGELIRELWGIEAGGKDKNQRPHCRCTPAADIGKYGPCPAGCVYCYARR